MADENNACDSVDTVAQIVLFAMYVSNGRTLTTIITFVKASCYVISHVICNLDHVYTCGMLRHIVAKTTQQLIHVRDYDGAAVI